MAIIEKETWPEALKIQVLRPIYKKGEKTEYGNYRPVALLPVVNKIIEKFFTNCIQNFIGTFKLLSKNQYGFQKNKGTNDALKKLMIS